MKNEKKKLKLFGVILILFIWNDTINLLKIMIKF